DAATGAEQRAWDLPPGLIDRLAFHATGRLLSFRVETPEGREYPTGQRIRVGRLRDLFGPTPLEHVKEFPEFKHHVFNAVATPDGSCFVVEGIGDGRRRAVRAYDGPTGRLLWSRPSSNPAQSGALGLDPTGRRLSWRYEYCAGGDRLLDVRT